MDLNSYFASVEQQENPSLRKKPVVIAPMDTDYTCVIAASYEAKAYGIRTGTMIKQAKRMCPDLHCVQVHHDLYVAYHYRIIEEVIKHTPINTIWSIDELSSRLPPGKRSINAARKIAVNIKRGIWKNVGSAITCSIGFAPSSLLAKIACDMHKPDGLTFLPQEMLPESLFPLHLTDIPGIGPRMEKRLNKMGIGSLRDLLQLDPRRFRKIWGSVQGERLWYLLHGYDLEPAATNISMIGHSRILNPKMRTPYCAKSILHSLSLKALHRLRHKGLYTACLSISLHTVQGLRLAKEVKIPATQDPFLVLGYIDALWAALIQNLLHQYQDISVEIKKVSVCLYKLSEESALTGELFSQADRPDILQKNLELINALERLQGKYKKTVVTLGMPP